jgi:hypothetical protein
LIGSDGSVSEQNRDGSEDAGGRVVSGLQQIGQSVLGEFSRARSDEINNQQPDPSASRLPKRGESIAKRVFRARKQTAGANPRAQQSGDQYIGWKVASRNKEVRLVFDQTASENADAEKDSDDDYQDDEIKIQQRLLFQTCTIL